MKIKEINTTLSSLDSKYYLSLERRKQIYPLVVLNNEYLILGDENTNFKIEVNEKDLESFSFWNFIFDYYEINIIILSKWWHKYFIKLNPEGIYKSLNWGINYKTNDEWKEWSTFQKNSEILLKYYNFSIQTIRLWDRLEKDIQKIWIDIIDIFKIKKNLLKEIINDIYDLTPQIQKKVSLECLEIAKEYLNQKSDIFPQDDIREKIKTCRYPLSYKRKKESYKLKKKIENYINLKNIEILLPEDLESQPIELKMSFRNKNELEEFITKLTDKKTKTLFLDLIEYAFQK